MSGDQIGKATEMGGNDVWLPRIIVGGLVLALVVVLVVVGVLAIRCQDVPAVLVGLASVLVGSLAGIATPFRNGVARGG